MQLGRPTAVKGITALVVALIALSAITSILPVQAKTKGGVSFQDVEGWRTIETDYVVIKVPAAGKHPMFLWWRTGDNETIYVVKFQGLIEFFPVEGFYKRRSHVEPAVLHELFLKKVELLMNESRERLEGVKKARIAIHRECLKASTHLMAASSKLAKGVEGVSGLKEALKEFKEELKGLREKALNANETILVERLNRLIAKVDEALNLASQLKEGLPSEGVKELLTQIRTILTDLVSLHRDLEGEAEKRINETEREINEVQERIKLVRGLVVEAQRRWHPPYFPFNNGVWELSDVNPIMANDGKAIGICFSFDLVKVHNPSFSFAEGNIHIKVRIYNTTVTEVIPQGVEYEVKPGELKMDLVIDRWKWNVDLVRPLLNDIKARGFNGISTPEPNLALWVNLASLNASALKLRLKDLKPDDVERNAQTERILIEGLGRTIHVSTNMSQGEEKHLMRLKAPHVKLKFAVENQTLGGFFKFIGEAVVNDTTLVPVNASYLEAGGYLRLFIAYPFFGSGKLEHDPSIGVDVDEAPQPTYKIRVPSGASYVPEAEAVTPAKALIPIEFAALGVTIITVAIVTVVVVSKRRKLSGL